MIDSLRSVAVLAAIAGGFGSVFIVGCGVVGFHYTYRGKTYTMTKPNSDYHELAVRDVRKQFGDPESQHEVAKLKGACELLHRYAADAPDPGAFTPARDLLDAEAKTTCHRWREREEHERTQAMHERAQADRERSAEEARRQQLARERQRDEARRVEENERLTAALERSEREFATCDATEAARTARRRHADILDRAPGAAVRKTCTPRMETKAVPSTCKDANGFARPCTQTVSTGAVAGYACPKSMDPEIVQLGLYQLELLDGYPYPEDHAIRVRDEECAAARARAQQTRSKLGQTAEVTP